MALRIWPKKCFDISTQIKMEWNLAKILMVWLLNFSYGICIHSITLCALLIFLFWGEFKLTNISAFLQFLVSVKNNYLIPFKHQRLYIMNVAHVLGFMLSNYILHQHPVSFVWQLALYLPPCQSFLSSFAHLCFSVPIVCLHWIPDTLAGLFIITHLRSTCSVGNVTDGIGWAGTSIYKAPFIQTGSQRPCKHCWFIEQPSLPNAISRQCSGAMNDTWYNVVHTVQYLFYH